METIRGVLLKLSLALGLAAAVGRIGGHRSLGGDVVDLRGRLLDLQRRQLELLKVDWGKPGLRPDFRRGHVRRSGAKKAN